MTELDRLAERVRAAIPTISVTDQRIPNRPFTIELSGTPKAGKSYVAQRLETFLSNNGFRVLYIPEAAAVNPLARKENLTFNVWNALLTLAKIIEETDRNRTHVLIFDRGLFDAFVWLEWHRMTGRIDDSEYHPISQFLTMERWRSLIDVVFLMTVDPELARDRDTEGLTDHHSRIMTPSTLAQINHAGREALKRFGPSFRSIHVLDTTDLDATAGTRQLVLMTLESFEQFTRERLLVVERASVRAQLVADRFVRATEPEYTTLIDRIRQNLRAEPREAAELNQEVLKVVCGAVLVSNGRLCILRRLEQNIRHALHNRYVIWAGGHMQEDDSGQSDVFEACLRRELDEELSIRTRYRIVPLGYYLETGSVIPRSAQHLFVVYRAELESDDVRVSLADREFKDKRGMSISGRFVTPEEASRLWNELDPWSQVILGNEFGVSAPPDDEKPLFR